MSHFEHVLVPGTAPLTLVLLHGTGGDENSMLEIGNAVASGATLISPRGKVNEGGANRWFRRFGEGVFDEADIRAQASDLAQFLVEVAPANSPMIALGYSNGANIGAALLTLHPDTFSGLVMWRGMRIFGSDASADLSGKKVLMLNGTNDPFAPLESAREQAERFRASGADVELEISGPSHGLSSIDFELTRTWLKKALPY
ncbi:MAG TPA: alpha/beta hydrolase [Fimbriimonas sp.]|nr:alpha/beta hydrolase [Fimbriimonas sp.]